MTTLYPKHTLPQAIHDLIAGQAAPTLLQAEAYDEQVLLAQCQAANDRLGVFSLYLAKLLLSYLLGAYEQALDAAAQAEQEQDAAAGYPYTPLYSAYTALARLAAYRNGQGEPDEVQRQVAAHQALLAGLVGWQHVWELVEAERQRVFGQPWAALEAYERASAGAHAQAALREAALANQLVAEFYLERGKLLPAQAHMQAAHADYARWGATAMVAQLEQRYPQLLEPSAPALQRLEAQLAEARQATEQAQRIKRTFLSTMNHDLRSPLTAILGFSSLMLREARTGHQELTPGQQQKLARIKRSGEHLLNLINNIFDYSLIEDGRMVVSPTTVNLTGMLDEVTQMFSLTATEKDLWLHVERDRWLPRQISTDGVKLRQVLINLLSNAFKATERGGVTIHAAPIPADAARPDQDRLWFEVTDTGCGIAPEDVDRLFEPFSQFVPGHTRVGVGLGLPISIRLVHLLGGELRLQSMLGMGTQVQFTISAATVVVAGESDAPSIAPTLASQESLSGELASLPADLLANLEQAARGARMAEVERLIGLIRVRDARVAQALAELADQFEYPRMAQIAQAARQAPGV
jgi:signal transduction histidine kinase